MANNIHPKSEALGTILRMEKEWRGEGGKEGDIHSSLQKARVQ